MGKEEMKWMEKREIPLPILMAQGVKEEPHVGSFDLEEESIGPTQKMSPSTTQPGCAYTSGLTRGVTRVVKGDKALYERGRYAYYHRDFVEAFETFQRLIRVYPQSTWRGAAYYWAGEATFHQGKTEEAFSYFQKVVDEEPGNEFYPYALYSCGWIQLKRGAYEKGFTFFHQVYEKTPTHSIAQPSLFWSGYCLYQIDHYEQAVREIEVLLRSFPKGIWRPAAIPTGIYTIDATLNDATTGAVLGNGSHTITVASVSTTEAVLNLTSPANGEQVPQSASVVFSFDNSIPGRLLAFEHSTISQSPDDATRDLNSSLKILDVEVTSMGTNQIVATSPGIALRPWMANKKVSWLFLGRQTGSTGREKAACGHT